MVCASYFLKILSTKLIQGDKKNEYPQRGYSPLK